jgi:hypothetical protein
MLVKQNHLKINQYFIKLKFIYCEIFMLDPQSKISEDRMSWIGLIHEFCGFTNSIRGWAGNLTIHWRFRKFISKWENFS